MPSNTKLEHVFEIMVFPTSGCIVRSDTHTRIANTYDTPAQKSFKGFWLDTAEREVAECLEVLWDEGVVVREIVERWNENLT